MSQLVSLLLALVLTAAPVAATCVHGMGGADEVAHGGMDMGEESPAEPCHDEAPASQPEAPPCASVCCVDATPAETPAVVAPPSVIAVVALLAARPASPRPVVQEVSPSESPPPAERLHAVFQRFLI